MAVLRRLHDSGFKGQFLPAHGVQPFRCRVLLLKPAQLTGQGTETLGGQAVPDHGERAKTSGHRRRNLGEFEFKIEIPFGRASPRLVPDRGFRFIARDQVGFLPKKFRHGQKSLDWDQKWLLDLMRQRALFLLHFGKVKY